MWSFRRQFIIFLIALAVIAIPLIIFLVKYQAQKVETCSDNILNGNETGVDCGGSCVRMCVDAALPLVKSWTVPIKITDNVYHIAALIENQNNAMAESVKYTLSMYDENNILIGERKGKTFVPANQSFVIAEYGFPIGKRAPKFAFVTLDKPAHWYRVDPRLSKSIIVAKNPVWEEMAAGTRLRADITNTESVPVDAISITAVGYDATDTAIAISKTVVDTLDIYETQPIAFTWPQTFKPVRTKFFITVDPFKQSSIPLLRDKAFHTK